VYPVDAENYNHLVDFADDHCYQSDLEDDHWCQVNVEHNHGYADGIEDHMHLAHSGVCRRVELPGRSVKVENF